MNNENIVDTMEIEVKAIINDESKQAFSKDLSNVISRLEDNIKYVIVFLYMQIGSEKQGRVLNNNQSKNMNIILQPKIRNYIPFVDLESMEMYKQKNISEDCIYISVDIDDFYNIAKKKISISVSKDDGYYALLTDENNIPIDCLYKSTSDCNIEDFIDLVVINFKVNRKTLIIYDRRGFGIAVENYFHSKFPYCNLHTVRNNRITSMDRLNRLEDLLNSIEPKNRLSKDEIEKIKTELENVWHSNISGTCDVVNLSDINKPSNRIECFLQIT